MRDKDEMIAVVKSEEKDAIAEEQYLMVDDDGVEHMTEQLV